MTKTEIVAFTAHLFNLKPGDILGDHRFARIHRARLAIYAGLWRRAELSGKQPSYSAIGRVVHRDHSTVIHGLRKAFYMMERDADFVAAVYRIATATVDDLPPLPPCNPELHDVGELDQQQERSMDNPEYTEGRINTAIARSGIKGLKVYWDGEIVSREEPPRFEVYLHEDGTDVFVTDDGRDFGVTRYCSDRVYRPIGSARNYDKLAELLRDTFITTEEEDV